jgi:anaerobic selenocysteine-containing dehydrogenase
MAYVLMKERHYDSAFVSEHVDHFDTWVDEQGIEHAGFREHVLSKYYPEKVASISGVPAKTIVEIAREFGRTRPSLAIAGQLGSAGTNGLFNTLAALSLNVLVGNIDKKGGLRMQRDAPFAHLPPVTPDEVASSGMRKPPWDEDTLNLFPLRNDSVFNACQNLLSSEQHQLDTLLIYGTNPAFGHPYAQRIRQVFDKIPFIVSFATILDESSEYADLVLPEHAYLERWMDSGSGPGIAFANAAVSQPVVDPLYQTRHTGDVLIELASQVLRSTVPAFPYRDFLGVLKNRFQGVFASGEGTVISGSFEESWLQFLKERGWQNLVYESFDDFWNLLGEQGGWWDPLAEELPRVWRSTRKTARFLSF